MSSHMEISSKGYLNWEAKRLYCRLWCSNDGSVVDCNILYNAFIVSFLLGHCGSRVLFLGRRSLVMQQLHLPLRRRSIFESKLMGFMTGLTVLNQFGY
ncbi:hypothetical protein P8452_21158 [Trifolium repens]|nr:hypothetical protein P8452_21158 [Trifolium repens]